MRHSKVPEFQPDSRKLPRLLLSHSELARVELDGRYLHWDELRHRTPPRGVTREEWWQLIKLARSMLAKQIPLTDEAGLPFTFAMTDSVQRASFGLEHELKGTGKLPPPLADQGSRKRYELSSLIEEALRSSQLEGASTTRSVAKELIRTKRMPRNDSERMVLSNYHAMEWARENRDQHLSTSAVLELHSIVTQGLLGPADGAGRFRRDDEKVRVVDNSSGEIVHTPPPAALLPSRMNAMCTFANGTVSDEPFIPPVLRAILLHFWLAYDHPFVDGNGRTARALFYWSMLNQGYKIAEFISISRAIKNARSQYEKAFLFSEADGNDVTYFVLNQVKMIRTALDDMYEYVREKMKEQGEVERSVREEMQFNERQLAVLSHALRHDDAQFTVEGHQAAHGISYETARTDLTSLADAGFLERTKIGKKFYFVPVKNLDRKLKP